MINRETICLIGVVMGFLLLVLAAFSGRKFLDLGEGGIGLGFVGFIVLLAALAGACNG